ncbi:hypothetical protein EC988_000441 [Linderina pennispora]|nr:hypothetical protein EC988_000441 [Linderina pennispora]
MVLNVDEIAKGFGLAVEAGEFAARNKHMQRKFVDVLKYTLLGMSLTYIAMHVLVFFPLLLLRAGNSLLSVLLRYDGSQASVSLLSTTQAVDHFFDSLPLVGLDLVIHAKPELFAGVFYAALAEIDPKYAQTLQTWPPRKHRWARIKFTVQRTLKRYAMTQAAVLLGRLPVVGWLVVPIGTVTMMAKFVGYPASGAIVLVSVLAPGSRHTTLFMFKSIMAVRDFSRDLLKPYFTALGAKPKLQMRFYKTYESMLVGFIMAFYFFVQLSWIGPAFFVLAQAAIAVFIARAVPMPPPYTEGAKWDVPDKQRAKAE